ncbi:PepSY domain-containing protein [Shewanella waksmanii]|uniref:PepSY domain-containing protein n=1 Tax=Shewanella waksmanii TaxID=213783 RepID=UPI0037351966
MLNKALRNSIALLLSVSSTTFATSLVELEHNQAKDLVSEGKILPLDITLFQVQDFCAGKLLDANLFQYQGHWVYELKIKPKRGSRAAIIVDASTGELQPNSKLPKNCRPPD